MNRATNILHRKMLSSRMGNRNISLSTKCEEDESNGKFFTSNEVGATHRIVAPKPKLLNYGCERDDATRSTNAKRQCRLAFLRTCTRSPLSFDSCRRNVFF